MITRLCNIIIRKAYLHEYETPPPPFLLLRFIDRYLCSMISYDKSDPELAAFWVDMARELFRNLNALYEQIEAHYADRTLEEGPGAQMAVSTTTLTRVVFG